MAASRQCRAPEADIVAGQVLEGKDAKPTGRRSMAKVLRWEADAGRATHLRSRRPSRPIVGPCRPPLKPDVVGATPSKVEVTSADAQLRGDGQPVSAARAAFSAAAGTAEPLRSALKLRQPKGAVE